MKKYFVQQKDENGEVSLSVNTSAQIIEMFGLRDCTGCDFEVFKSEEFGKVVRLEHIPPKSAPFNHHTWINSENGEVEIEGYSTER